MLDRPTSDPRTLWPDVSDWEVVGMSEPVYRVRTTDSVLAYVRPDDGSAALLRQLGETQLVPTPLVLDARDEWLLLSALPGIPLHQAPVWRHRPDDVARIVATALLALERAGVTHGDMSLPNILGDPITGRLTGIVDWRFACRFSRTIDVASAVWNCGFNGYSPDVAVNVLRACHWSRADVPEVEALGKAWLDLTGPPEAPHADALTLPSL